ncbi:MAG: TRAP transporter large permease subunit [Deltaproteobacteria bacterium]|nr:TRAP transporter large permease subunit [Deltaproteobacteria bacterium]
MAIICGVLCLFIFIGIGVPIGFSLGFAGFIGLTLTAGLDTALGMLMTTPYRGAAHYSYTTIPLFVLMAEFLNESGFAQRAFVGAYKWIGHWRGGLAMATFFGGAVFGACSGSSSASAATFSRIAVPEMLRFKYSPELASGTVAIAATLAAIIPPSLLMVIYGISTEESIGKLLIAGMLPGIMMTIIYIIGILIVVSMHPDEAPPIPPFTWKERWASVRGMWPLFLIAVVVLGSLYSGLATPTEAAAVGAVMSLVTGLANRSISGHKIMEALRATLKTCGMIFIIIIGATIFAYFMTLTGTSQAVISYVSALPVHRIFILLLILLIYVVLGMFLDAIGCMLLTIPLVFPLITSLGYNPIWFGVILVMILEIGLITPPVGINCFIVSGAAGIPLTVVFRGGVRLLVFSFIGLAIMIIFPGIAMLLPNMMK